LESNGYVLGGLSFLLILPSILMLMVLIDIVNLDKSVNILQESDTTFYITSDVERNIPIISRQVLKETVKNTIKTGDSLPNSRIVIKNDIESRINHLNANYENNTGVIVKCDIKSVDSSLDPFEIEVNSSIMVMKENISYNKNFSQNISISESYLSNSAESKGYYSIPDPLPFIKCKKFGGVSTDNGKIRYGSSLRKYLDRRGVKVADAYENASSPLYIKKCPYDPYISHGNSKKLLTLKNCIENGYYHESNDGACLLCRLEGKSTCNHYGFETFVIPDPSNNQRILRAPCSIDHIIFSDKNFLDTYPGEAVEYFFTGNTTYKIFLDNGHRTKYGIIEYLEFK
jgi:hypothetical protein